MYCSQVVRKVHLKKTVKYLHVLYSLCSHIIIRKYQDLNELIDGNLVNF